MHGIKETMPYIDKYYYISYIYSILDTSWCPQYVHVVLYIN